MKIKHFIWVPLVLLIWVIPASADFYRFVDEKGNTIYTDDINKVPVEQRGHVQYYEESVSDPAETTNEKHASSDTSKNDAATADEDLKERERLQAQENELSRELPLIRSPNTIKKLSNSMHAYKPMKKNETPWSQK
jgi:hypothetical protein